MTKESFYERTRRLFCLKLDIIGDIHGCFSELKQLIIELGYSWNDGVPKHPNGRLLAFVGDLTDRGANSLAVIDLVSSLVAKKLAYYVPGNHCDKLYRYFLGRNVQLTHGLETTDAELQALSAKEFQHYRAKFCKLVETSPLYHVLDDGKLVIAHAGIRQDYIGRTDIKVKTFVLYGDITGEFYADGRPIRRDWSKRYQGKALIVYGHTPVSEARFLNHTVNIDTGAVFGGKLTALSYPELTTTSVPSSMPYIAEKFTTFDD